MYFCVKPRKSNLVDYSCICTGTCPVMSWLSHAFLPISLPELVQIVLEMVHRRSIHDLLG